MILPQQLCQAELLIPAVILGDLPPIPSPVAGSSTAAFWALLRRGQDAEEAIWSRADHPEAA